MLGNENDVALIENHSTGYVLDFDLLSFHKLDDFALLACQKYNLQNDTDWFGTFRGGLYGFYSRIHGIAVHYQLVHNWIARQRSPIETEYHVASVLFNMDSALECLIYALNALGYAASPGNFRDITSRKELSQITPRDVLGMPRAEPPKDPLMKGYSEIFPDTQKHCVSNCSLIQTVVDLHDVSKHRRTIYIGGMLRSDPPLGFYESISISGDRNKEALYQPSAEINLQPNPKLPKANRTPAERHECPTLEGLTSEFVSFIYKLGQFALADAKANIELPHKEFLQCT